MFMSLCGYSIVHMDAGGGQKRVLGPLGLELQAVVSWEWVWLLLNSSPLEE